MELSKFDVKLNAPAKPYDDTWELKSYCNVLTGQKDFPGKQIKAFKIPDGIGIWLFS